MISWYPNSLNMIYYIALWIRRKCTCETQQASDRERDRLQKREWGWRWRWGWWWGWWRNQNSETFFSLLEANHMQKRRWDESSIISGFDAKLVLLSLSGLKGGKSKQITVVVLRFAAINVYGLKTIELDDMKAFWCARDFQILITGLPPVQHNIDGSSALTTIIMNDENDWRCLTVMSHRWLQRALMLGSFRLS